MRLNYLFSLPDCSRSGGHYLIVTPAQVEVRPLGFVTAQVEVIHGACFIILNDNFIVDSGIIHNVNSDWLATWTTAVQVQFDWLPLIGCSIEQNEVSLSALVQSLGNTHNAVVADINKFSNLILFLWR